MVMMGNSKIQILPPEEARRIAAGELIDRPASLVREFMDNAIDAGARVIETVLEGGGIARISVIDDGEGMDREDLELCCLTHATSKIRSLDDLKTASTLGFRGEALAAAQAVSRLEILSSRDGREAWKLTTGPGEKHPPCLEQSCRAKGTSVSAFGLFDSIPVRKRFLKREGSETALCAGIFNDKALASPDIEFRLILDGKLKSFYPPVSSLKERFCRIFVPLNEKQFMYQIESCGEGFSVTIVFGGPEIFRNDRRMEFVFANRRRIQDYSLIQALEYGLQGWFPNGTHPVGAVFIDIDPALADFNIHPAKKEARFTESGAIHHAVTEALRNFCQSRNMEIVKNFREKPDATEGDFAFDESPKNASFWAAEKSVLWEEAFPAAEERAVPEAGGLRYLGRVFGVFLLVEKGDVLYCIDQHAAHERILYDRFLAGPIPRQELLVPLLFSTESPEDDSFLKTRKEDLARLGIVIKEEEGRWQVEALPQGWRLSDDETIAEILHLRTAGENMAERWAATLSCHGAVKDGDWLDRDSALALAKESFGLAEKRCPHGRPIWLELSRNDILKAVKRPFK
jgi:DNA mismatch repair protein MutL